MVAELQHLALVLLGVAIKSMMMSSASRSGVFVSWRFDLQHGGIGTIPVETHAVAQAKLKLTLTTCVTH